MKAFHLNLFGELVISLMPEDPRELDAIRDLTGKTLIVTEEFPPGEVYGYGSFLIRRGGIARKGTPPAASPPAEPKLKTEYAVYGRMADPTAPAFTQIVLLEIMPSVETAKRLIENWKEVKSSGLHDYRIVPIQTLEE